MGEKRDDKITQWALHTLARLDPDKAEGIEAAMRAMKVIQAQGSNVTALGTRRKRQP